MIKYHYFRRIMGIGNFHAFEGIFVFVVFVFQRNVIGKIKAYQIQAKRQDSRSEQYQLADPKP
jgi:hypothetical protein